MAQAAFKTCEICVSSPGHHYCQECDQLFCDGCKISHLRTKMTKNHTFLSGSNINPEVKQYCNEHDENFIYYCKECDTPICKICVIENHKKHDLCEINTSTEINKTEIESEINIKLNKLETNIMGIQQGTNAYHGDVDGVMHAIRKEGVRLKELIDTQVEDLIRSVKEQHATQLQTLQSIGNAFKTDLNKVKEQHQIYQDTTKITETSALLLKLKEIKSQLAAVEVKQLTVMPSVKYVKSRATRSEIKKLIGDLTFGETGKREETRNNRDTSPSRQNRYRCYNCKTEIVSSKPPM
ncbi:E3 ubiquitin-protein ligase TRIM9-like [Mytilus californianus]|uniref:E3 ubiquitin-protein ligase TRIM9-like n=1 Tax=Mytilus californianus TaxID=6549 RepID=UPI002247911B|nr:E3 ubiquitin-protein ligase TRIM9-like [Mytilus californianus]